MNWKFDRSPQDGHSRVEDSECAGVPLVPGSAVEKFLLLAVDCGFGGLIFLLPFVMGGREAAGNFALVALAAWTAIAWALLQIVRVELPWNHSRALWLMPAAVGLVALQLIELPAPLHRIVSPETGRLLEHWGLPGMASAEGDHWAKVSLTPVETRRGLMVLLAYCLIVVTAVQRIRTREHVFCCLRCVGAAAMLMSVFALVQYATSNGKFFWVYDHPNTNTNVHLKGAFTNRNHFAHFLALGTAGLLWCLIANPPSRKRPSMPGIPRTFLFAVVALPVTIGTALSSLSRGGIIALFAVCAVFLLCTARRSMLRPRALTALCGIGLITVGALFLTDESIVRKRIEGILNADVNKLDVSGYRRTIWAANVAGIRDFPLLGTGIGSHQTVYPVYLESFPGFESVVFTHAENGYLQTALESGLIGTTLILTGFAMGIAWCIRGVWNASHPSTAAAFAAVLSVLAASLVHSAVDFVWYAPACVVVVILLLACACRLRQLQQAPAVSTDAVPTPRVPVRVAWLCSVAGVACLMLTTMWRPLMAQSHWHDYLRVSRLLRDSSPEDGHDPVRLQQRIRTLKATLRADPHHADAHLRMAKAYTAAFDVLQLKSEVPMTLFNIREAADAAAFDSADAQDAWLNRILSRRREHLERALRHTRKAIGLSPLTGSAYVALSDLVFLEGASDELRQPCLDQAIRTRPFDPRVLLVVGWEKMRQGDAEEAISLWRTGFNRNERLQRTLIDALLPSVKARVLIDHFEPNIQGLTYIIDQLRPLNRPADLAVAISRFAGAMEKLAEESDLILATSCYMKAYKSFREINDQEAATRVIDAAYQRAPSSFEVKYHYGALLLEQGRYAKASRLLDDCAREHPDNDGVNRLAEAARQRNRQGSGPDAGDGGLRTKTVSESRTVHE